MEQLSKVQEPMAVLAVVLVVEMVMQTMPEVAMVILHQLHHLKVMMVAVVAAVELTHVQAAEAAAWDDEWVRVYGALLASRPLDLWDPSAAPHLPSPQAESHGSITPPAIYSHLSLHTSPQAWRKL